MVGGDVKAQVCPFWYLFYVYFSLTQHSFDAAVVQACNMQMLHPYIQYDLDYRRKGS